MLMSFSFENSDVLFGVMEKSYINICINIYFFIVNSIMCRIIDTRSMTCTFDDIWNSTDLRYVDPWRNHFKSTVTYRMFVEITVLWKFSYKWDEHLLPRFFHMHPFQTTPYLFIYHPDFLNARYLKKCHRNHSYILQKATKQSKNTQNEDNSKMIGQLWKYDAAMMFVVIFRIDANCCHECKKKHIK